MIAPIKKPIEIPVEESTDISTGLSKNYSVEEYLAIEVESEVRNEYRNGEIVPMAGGLPNHNQITGNTYATDFVHYVAHLILLQIIQNLKTPTVFSPQLVPGLRLSLISFQR